jgi:hypothetical protein
MFISSACSNKSSTASTTKKDNVGVSDNLQAVARLEGITKITFYDGREGMNRPLVVEDKKKIDEFINLLKDTKVKKQKDVKDNYLRIYSAAFYKDNQLISEIAFTTPLKVNEDYYEVVKNNPSKETLDEYLQSVNPSWKK